MLKKNLLTGLLEKMDLNGLSKSQLLSDSDCFGILYGAGACRRCTHEVKLGRRKYPLNAVCKAVQEALLKGLDEENEMEPLLKRVKDLMRVKKIKPKKVKPAIGVSETAKLSKSLRAVKIYAKRAHNELDWVAKIYDISQRYGVKPIDIVNKFSEVIRRSCNVGVLRDLIALSEKTNVS